MPFGRIRSFRLSPRPRSTALRTAPKCGPELVPSGRRAETHSLLALLCRATREGHSRMQLAAGDLTNHGSAGLPALWPEPPEIAARLSGEGPGEADRTMRGASSVLQAFREKVHVLKHLVRGGPVGIHGTPVGIRNHSLARSVDAMRWIILYQHFLFLGEEPVRRAFKPAVH